MRCYSCDYEFDNETGVCPNCGTDNRLYRAILSSSARCYNEGLELAKVRNLTGAANKLTAALRFDKMNTDARNLLGLVYFETGETVLAIREWVISKNLQAEDNEVDRYLNEIEYGPGLLQQLDDTNRKYNQALAYCQEGSRDLTRIQLKRVLKNNPRMVKARQLLALIYMQDDEYENARKELRYAMRIDGGNPLTVSYLNEVNDYLREKNEKKKSKAAKKEAVAFQDGNDTVVMPKQTFIEALDSSKGGILNILIGIVIGLLVCIFLVVPEVRQRDNSSTANALVRANENAANSATDVTALQSQVSDLQTKLDQYEGQSDVKTSYEKLIAAMSAATAGDAETAKAALSAVNRDVLDASGQAAYDNVSGTINAAAAQAAFDAAETARNSGDYDTAITQYLACLAINERYSDGDALYRIAQCYEKKNDTANAVVYYQKLAEYFPDTKNGRKAARKVTSLGGAAAETNTTDNTGAVTDMTGTAADNTGATADTTTEAAQQGDTQQ